MTSFRLEISSVIKVAPTREKRVRYNSQVLFVRKMLMKLKVEIKSDQNCTFTKVFLIQQDINYKKWLLIKRETFLKIH